MKIESLKYGVIIGIPNFDHLSINSLHNIGDNIQSHAVENLYSWMNISPESIVKLNRYEFNDYDGRFGYVLIPMCAYFTIGNAQDLFPLSPFIIPVYFSFGLSNDVNDPALLTNFRRHEPIGTRDERVMQMFRKQDVLAFVSGCLTITFPRREQLLKKGKVFLVDVPDELLDYIPSELVSQVERITHMYPYEKVPADKKEADRLDSIARQLYARYEKEARLVVTTRLHCAAPCIAMGIPTIVVANNISDRFAWLDRYIYTSNKFSEINWNIAVPDIEIAKNEILTTAAEVIQSKYSKFNSLTKISFFYESRELSNYNSLIFSSLFNKLTEVVGPIRFAFWGQQLTAHD